MTKEEMWCHCTKCDFAGRVEVTTYEQHSQIRWTCPKCGFLWKPLPCRSKPESHLDKLLEVSHLRAERERYRSALERIASAQSENGCILSLGEAVTLAGEALYHD